MSAAAERDRRGAARWRARVAERERLDYLDALCIAATSPPPRALCERGCCAELAALPLPICHGCAEDLRVRA